MQDHRDVKWVLIVSLIIFWMSWPLPSFNFLFFGLISNLPFYHLPTRYTLIELVWYAINRADTLTLLLTITFGALFTAGFDRKSLWYRLSIYLFIISMVLFFITILQMFIGLPYR